MYRFYVFKLVLLFFLFFLGTRCKWRIWLETCPWWCFSASPKFGSTHCCCWHWCSTSNAGSACHHFSYCWNVVHRVCQRLFRCHFCFYIKKKKLRIILFLILYYSNVTESCVPRSENIIDITIIFRTFFCGNALFTLRKFGPISPLWHFMTPNFVHPFPMKF